MSFTTTVVLIAVFDLLIIAALAAVCLVPFGVDRRPRAAVASVRRLGSADLLEDEAAA